MARISLQSLLDHNVTGLKVTHLKSAEHFTSLFNLYSKRRQ
jgi:hypothetical protein